MIYKMELSDSVDTMVFDLLEVPIVDKDITGIAENTTIDGNVFNDYLWLKKQYVQKWSIMCQDEYDRLRGFWTRQFGNAEVPFYRLFYGENVYEDKNFLTSDGFTQITNPTVRTAPLSLTHLYGNAEQKTLSGKNKVNAPQTVERAYGSRTAEYTVDLTGEYTISGSIYAPNNSAAGSSGGVGIDIDGTTNWIIIPQSALTNSIPFSRTVNGHITKIRLTAYGTQSGSKNVYTNIMLESGSTATPYEEYCGGVPSPNPDYPQEIKTVTGAQTVKITGKNLLKTDRTLGTPSNTAWGNTTKRTFDFDEYIAGITRNNYYSGPASVTVVVDGSAYTVTSLQGGYGVGLPVELSPNTTYTLSTKASVMANIQMGIGYYRADGTFDSFLSPSSTGVLTFTTPENTSFAVIVLATTTGQTCTYYDIQLELGTTATAYEPYQSQSQVINLGGSNLFNTRNFYVKSANVESTVVDDNSIILHNAGTAGWLYSAFQIDGLKANTDYAIRFNQSNSNTPMANWFGVRTTSRADIYNGAYTSGANLTFNSGANTSLLFYFYVQTGAGTVAENTATITDIMLNEGTNALPYAPYTDYAYELAKIGTYQDYIWNDDGTWKIHKEVGKVVFDGTENWSKFASSGTISFYTNVANGADSVIKSNYFSDRHIAGLPDLGAILYNGNSNKNMLFRMMDDTTITEAADFKTWLSTHPTTVYYSLATPTDTEITDSELIEQLNHIYELYQGQNNLWLIGTGAQGEIDGTYRLIYDEETDIIPKTPVVLTLTDGGVINPCGCRQNIQLIMRETEGE